MSDGWVFYWKIMDEKIKSEENRMRIMANLIIDRIYEDKRNNMLKFQPKPTKKKGKNKV